MPQKVIKFAGINRYVNEFQNSGECEELINLRPEVGGGYSVVKHKQSERHGVENDRIYEHSFGDTYNRIVVTDGVVEHEGHQVITDEFRGKAVSISYAGNVLVIYCSEEKRQAVYKFEGGEYVSYTINIKPITGVEVNYSYSSQTLTAYSSAVADDYTVESYNDALQKAASGFYSKFPNGLSGAAVIGCTYELKDGSELWSTAFIVANVTRCNGYIKPTIDNESKEVVVSGASKVSLHLTFADIDIKELKRINVYASRPVLPFEVKKEVGSDAYISDMSLKDVGLDGQVMYYQGSVDISEPTADFTLNFSKAQTGERIMDVTSGCIERNGESVSYNNRFHFYRSEVQHLIQIPTVSDRGNSRTSLQHWVAYVEFENGWKLINKRYTFSESAVNDFIYPMAGVKRIAFVKANWEANGDFSVPYNEIFTVNMKDSTAYNYSYAFDVTPSLEPADGGFFDMIEEAGQVYADDFEYDTTVFWKNEMNAINVSAPFNPYVFPVEYSYSFGGEILDLVTSYLPISTTQVGQYPLSVFTANGIYALEQGDGNVLYSNVTPIQPMVINGKATTTPEGTFFVSSKILYLLSGRSAANVSILLDGKRELGVRETEAYKKLCCTNGSLLPNFSGYLSKVDFEDYIDTAVLVYDQFRNELIISNSKTDLPYSYVFNLNTRTYHKISRRYLPASNGAHVVLEEIDGDRSIVDLHKEIDGEVSIMMQSRPMAFEVLYTHIQRLLLLIDTTLSNKQGFSISVFGSDNLSDWKCIISSQKTNVAMRHIRTNRAAKSYKDYVILVNGKVPADTNIYDLIADYTVVQRRLG